MSNPFFSIIMPTYNSELTIEMALKSIRMQDLPEEQIEILVIDGGSQDRTREIAAKYKANILDNTKKFPEYAKRIGFKHARGRWVVMQDSDEVLTDSGQMRKRKAFFEENQDVYCLILDKYIPGRHCGIACAYTNWFGDPFNYVVYHMSDSRVRDNREYLVQSTAKGNIYRYSQNDIIPIGDGGTTTIDIIKAKELFGETYYTQEFAVSIFYNMIQSTKYMGCIPEDNIVHYSTASLSSYLKKLHFRIYTNLNSVEQSGYSVRARKNSKLRKKKIVFIVYALSIIAPLMDSIRMSMKYKRLDLLMHFVYTYYVVIMMAVELLRKYFHIKNGEYTYGK